MIQSGSSAYHSARETSCYYPIPDAGLLKMGGEDRLDFLQRQTTNDLARLSSANTVVTVLTSPTARILDVMQVIQRQDALHAITLPGGYHSRTFDYLKGRIFFMDQVEIVNASGEYQQVELLGPETGDILNRLDIRALPSTDEVSLINSSQIEGVILGQSGLLGPSYRLIVPEDGGGSLEALLEDLGAQRMDTESYQLLRVESGVAGAGFELTDQFNPLEVGLEKQVSGEKGCYTGQEILARQITYDKVARQLVGLKLNSSAEPGWALSVEGRTVGSITSAVVSPRFGPIALGVVKKSHAQAGTVLEAGESKSGAKAKVAALPFQA